MQVAFPVNAKHLLNDLDIMIFLGSSDMAFGSVDVQFVIKHVKRHQTPSQIP